VTDPAGTTIVVCCSSIYASVLVDGLLGERPEDNPEGAPGGTSGAGLMRDLVEAEFAMSARIAAGGHDKAREPTGHRGYNVTIRHYDLIR